VIIKYNDTKVGQWIIVPKGIAVVEKCHVSGDQKIGNITGKCVSHRCACTPVDAACTSIGENMDSFFGGLQPDEVSVPYRHAIRKMKITSGRKSCQDLLDSIQFA